uniref:Cysteine--tRNA ligase n=1 Tax=candidate division WOR-3 bacterium TaxID=2052148 RepID=A0A7C4Y689_UNCW3
MEDRLKIFNTLTGKKEDFIPVEDGKVKMYFCGMTLQESPHIGHMRAFVTADIIHRYFRFLNYDVSLIINFTDIDDKVLKKAEEDGVDYRMITARFEKEFRDACEYLNILPAKIYPRATQHIQEIIELIERLIEKGYAYVSDGDVYFRVRKFKEYGKLSKKVIDELIAGARVKVEEKKEDPLDFALWKSVKENEPYWVSPWGKGRPGWHIECSSMSMHYLGETFDIHGGGDDLIFPHHENEIAQSEAATGKIFARYWVHNAMLTIKGEKMSKSLKNFVPILEMKEKYNPNEIRLFLLSSHYRTKLDYSEELLDNAKKGYERIKNYLESTEEKGEVSDETRKRFILSMNDDFNTPEVIGYLFELIKIGNKTEENEEKGRIKRDILFLLDNLGFKREEKKEDYSVFIKVLLNVREILRKDKDFKAADLIREELKKEGYIIEDTKEGPRIKKI